MKSPAQFQELFCRRSGCEVRDFEEQAFRACLYSHARFLAGLVRKVSPGFFAEDFKFIGHLGASTTMEEVAVDVLNFHTANTGSRAFWRRSLKIRVSARKAVWLARNFLPRSAPVPLPTSPNGSQ